MLLALKSLLIHCSLPSNQKTLWLHQRFQLTCNVMSRHSLLSQLYLILSGPGVLGFWRVQSLGKLSCSLCINTLSFCICCHITQSPPFLLLDKRMHRSQNEGSHSCWDHSKNKACIFLWLKGLTFRGLSPEMQHFASQGDSTESPCNIQPHLPILYISTWVSRADRNGDVRCFELQLWNRFNVCFAKVKLLLAHKP